MAWNRMCAVTETNRSMLDRPEKFPPVALYLPMKVKATGVNQVLLDHRQPNDWSTPARPEFVRRQHPDVDIHECPICHSVVAVEG